jgi:hypothetical protein
MARLHFPFLALLLAAPVAFAQTTQSESALRAIRLLPKGEAKRISRIEAREGTPAPERWHILVHDPKETNGLREYVVAGGELVAARALSQFAEHLQPGDVVGLDAIKVDSDRAVKLAEQYALANELSIATVDYALRKEGQNAVPLWTLTCLDAGGKEVGKLVVSAGKGTVVSHDGFPVEPQTKPVAKVKAEATPKVAANPPIAKTKPPATATDVTGEPPVRRAVAAGSEQPPPVAAPAEPVTPLEEERRPSIFRRTGGTLQKIFTGRNTISR